MSDRRLLIPAGVALIIAIWGTTFAAIRVVLEEVPPFAGLALRFLPAGLLLLALRRMTRGSAPEPIAKPAHLFRLWAVLTLCGYCALYGLVYWGEQYVSSGLTAVLVSIHPMIIVFLAHALLPSEPLQAGKVLGAAIGLAGVAVLFVDDLALPRETRWAAVALLAAPFFAALTDTLVKKWGREVHAIDLVAVPMTLCGVVMGLASLLIGESFDMDLSVRTLGALGYLCLVGTVLVYPLYFWLLKHVAATRLSLVTLAMPVVAVIVGTLALGEPFTMQAAAGTLLVLLGAGLALRA